MGVHTNTVVVVRGTLWTFVPWQARVRLVGAARVGVKRRVLAMAIVFLGGLRPWGMPYFVKWRRSSLPLSWIYVLQHLP